MLCVSRVSLSFGVQLTNEQHTVILSIACKAGTKATEDMTPAFAPINLLYPCTYGVDHAMRMLI